MDEKEQTEKTFEENVSEETINVEEKVDVKKPKMRFLTSIRNRGIKNLLFLILIALIALIILVLIIISIFNNKDSKIEIKVKSSLEKIVEKSDLETTNIVYNVIAKECKENTECNKSSNDIDDFYYVVSCKGTITAGIDFKEVKINVNKEEKKIIIEMPEATILGDPSIGSIKFLNGEDVPASELPNARKLCQETVIEKSNADGNLIPSAKEQAKVVLEEFYKQWIKAYDESYVVEVK